MVGHPRYFQIGFMKCGTTSIAAFFNRNRIPCVHYDEGRLGRTMERNQLRGIPLLTGYDDRYQAFTNMEYFTARSDFAGYRLYREIMRDYEDARFILNTRDREGWIRSMAAFALRQDPHRVVKEQYYQWKYGTTDLDAISDVWREEWDAHHRNVMSDIPAKRLLVFDIGRDDPALLCRFAGLPAECARHYGRENASLGRYGTVVSRYVPMAVKRAVPGRVKHRLKRWLRHV